MSLVRLSTAAAKTLVGVVLRAEAGLGWVCQLSEGVHGGVHPVWRVHTWHPGDHLALEAWELSKVVDLALGVQLGDRLGA